MPIGSSIKNQTKLVIDASVAVKLFNEESGTKEMENLLARCFEGKVELYAPDLLIYEVANALYKGVKLDADKITAAIETLYNSPIQFFSPEKLLATSAVSLMVRHNITFYDAAYAALARVLHVPLLSADIKGHKKIESVEFVELS
jgi:predicted nucleic acid-binding protein